MRFSYRAPIPRRTSYPHYKRKVRSFMPMESISTANSDNVKRDVKHIERMTQVDSVHMYNELSCFHISSHDSFHLNTSPTNPSSAASVDHCQSK